jgi:hypothetical protein
MVHNVQTTPLFGVSLAYVPPKLNNNVKLLDGNAPWLNILVLSLKD